MLVHRLTGFYRNGANLLENVLFVIIVLYYNFIQTLVLFFMFQTIYT